jgi:hypothetical protein
MKAGDALGLLAGLGALNAIRGGREGTGKRFTGLMDMLDGGGAGASGDRFEGGGLLSILGNLFAKPLEAQNNVERIAADTNATKAVTKTLEDMAKGGTLTSRLDGKDGLPMPMTRGTPITEYSDGLLAPTLPTVSNTAAMEDIINYNPDEFDPRVQSGAAPARVATPSALLSTPSTSAGYVGAPSSDGYTIGSNMSGGSQPRAPMPELPLQGQFSPPAESVSRMTSSDFAVADYLERNGIPMTMENITRYRPIVMAAM